MNPYIKNLERLEDLARTSFSGEVSRDSKGRTYCPECGRVVSKRVEIFSLKKFKEILCFECQKGVIDNGR